MDVIALAIIGLLLGWLKADMLRIERKLDQVTKLSHELENCPYVNNGGHARRSTDIPPTIN